MTFTNMLDFNKKLKDSGKTLTEKQFVIMVRKVAFDMLSNIVIRTRWKTGTAKANWQVSINEDNTGQIDATDKEGRATIGKGASVIGTLKNMSLKDIHRVIIANHLGYITKLEEMDGMVKLAIARAGTIF